MEYKVNVFMLGWVLSLKQLDHRCHTELERETGGVTCQEDVLVVTKMLWEIEKLISHNKKLLLSEWYINAAIHRSPNYIQAYRYLCRVALDQ